LRGVPLMSWPAARNVLDPEAEAARAVGAAVLPAALEGADAAVLVAELQAVSSKAAPASRPPATIGRALREFAVNINVRTL
jgi:hypothetical protein